MSRRVELAARACALRARGLRLAEVADHLGVSPTYASDLVRDPDGALARARKRRNGGSCGDCGGVTDGSNGRAKAPGRCAACARRHRLENALWSRDRVILALLTFADERGRAPNASEAGRACGLPSHGVVMRRFGSWRAALEAAGLPPPGRAGSRRREPVGAGR
ncbi:MAG: Homing endonuclease associated repeat [Miltoncostaeaceae bacterium]|nr:Homing endonuclease associated repeat [Miltoncostaeaceae bacterium]